MNYEELFFLDSESSSGSDSDTSDDLDSSESADEEEGRKVPEVCGIHL